MSRRRGSSRDERGSISLFLLVAMVGLMLGALLVPMIVTSARTTTATTSRVRAVDVAQAGIDVVTGKIRAAVGTTGIGDASLLPCATTASPISGNVGTASYSVTIDYFTVDPDKNPSATPMLCVRGYGTYEVSSGSVTPSYARMTSVGTVSPTGNGGTQGRTLITTYLLQTSNVNISGGVIRIYPPLGGTSPLCMDAGSSTPVAGTTIVLQSCSTASPPAARQVFAYRNDLTIKLLSSVTTAYPDGLCLTTATPPAAGNPVTLQACPAAGATPAYNQQWSFNDSGAYQASTSTSSTDGTLSGVCMSVGTQSAGQAVVMAACDGNVSSTAQAWIPMPSVGAGAAVAPQWVNALEFGRCLDVTGGYVSTDHLIDYPCKQNPYAGAVRWNQKFAAPAIASGATNATGPFVTTPSSNYCLTTTSTAGGYATVSPCVSGQGNQQWTVYNGAKTLPYSTKYTIVDTNGRCLGLTSPVTGETWSAIEVDTCDGSTAQKWNASPNLIASTLQNTREK